MSEKNEEFVGRDDFLLAKVNSDSDKQQKPSAGGPTHPEYIEFEGSGDSEEWEKDELKNK